METKLIEIYLSVSDWLDPSTFRVMFDSSNTNANMANKLRPIGGPLSFLSRIRFLAGGQILEDIDLYNKVHEMINNFTSEGSRYNDYAESFGDLWESRDTLDSRPHNTAANGNSPNAVNIVHITKIFGNSYQTVIFKPLLWIFYQKNIYHCYLWEASLLS